MYVADSIKMITIIVLRIHIIRTHHKIIYTDVILSLSFYVTFCIKRRTYHLFFTTAAAAAVVVIVSILDCRHVNLCYVNYYAAI